MHSKPNRYRQKILEVEKENSLLKNRDIRKLGGHRKSSEEIRTKWD